MSVHWHHWCSEEIQTSTEERANLPGNHQLNIGMTLVSVAIGLEFFHTLQFLLLGEYLGPIVICVVKVFKDAARVSIIFFIIFIAHAVCAWSMFKPFQAGSRNTTTRYQLIEESLKSKQGLFDGMLWRVLNPEGPEMVQINDTTKGGEPFSLEFSHLMGIILWAVYQAIITILLVNILIAIMNSTYIKVWQSSNTEWKYSKIYYQVNLQLICFSNFVIICLRPNFSCQDQSSHHHSAGSITRLSLYTDSNFRERLEKGCSKVPGICS